MSKENNSQSFIVTNIKYDTDGVRVKLPKEMVILVPNDCEDIAEFISDEISNRTGFCHLGFNTTPEIDSF